MTVQGPMQWTAGQIYWKALQQGGQIMSEYHELFLRAYAVSLDKKHRKESMESSESKWPQYALIFDCESRITADQTLTFGFWRFCELRNGEYCALEEGLLHDDNGLTAKEFDLLRIYAKTHVPETGDGGCDRLRIYSRSRFITEVFGMAIQAKALIVCF